MKDFLERTLRQKVKLEENKEIYSMLPLVYRGRYHIYNVETNGLLWVAASPKSEVGLATLRKDRARIEKAANLNCALFLKTATFYVKEKLLEEGIPFVILEKQVCLPFIGVLLSSKKERELEPVHMISYLTQKLLFTAMYERWNGVRVSEAAQKLGVTKMSVSRCFDELEYLNINVMAIKGKARAISIPNDLKQLWKRLETVVRSPVISRYELREDMKLEKKAGISALCEYSLLSDNNYPTYAVTKIEIKDSGVRNKRRAGSKDEIVCVVLELGYFIDFTGNNIEDPLSVVLSLTDEEKSDERVNISVDEMLEEYIWSRG